MVDNLFGIKYDSIDELLALLVKTKDEYEYIKFNLKKEQADLRINTDWSTAIENKSRPSNDDKDAWILLETQEIQEYVNELELKKLYLSELLKIEKIRLKQE